MSKAGKDKLKESTIPPHIVEAISALPPERIIRSESCPSYPLETFNIQEKLDESLKKKDKVKETEYNIGNYLIKKTLGQGTFGKVKLGIYLPTQEKVAIKILEKDRIVEKDDEIRVKREFDMLALFNHPNVILVAEIFESSDSFYSVMEFCEGGELFNYIVKNRRLSEEEAAFFYYQLINGLEYIHSLGIVHRDLKPENLLLTNEHLLKIIDFGLSNYFKEGQKDLLATPCGSPCYASPEMVAGKKYNGFKIDIWSSGIILYAMLCGYLPFEDKDNDILFEKILECKLIFPKYVKKLSRDLIEKILVTDPDKRISIPEIKNHPFYLKGKELFEQEFSVYQITKDVNDKTSLVENIDLNHIVENQMKIENEKNKENKENNVENEENIDLNEEIINITDNDKNEFRDLEEKKEIHKSDLMEQMNEIEINIKDISDNEDKLIDVDNIDNTEKLKDEKIENKEFEENEEIKENKEIKEIKDNKEKETKDEKEKNISDRNNMNKNKSIVDYELDQLEQKQIDHSIKKDNDEKSCCSRMEIINSDDKVVNEDNINNNIDNKEFKEKIDSTENKEKINTNVNTVDNKENLENLENVEKKGNEENKDKVNKNNDIILVNVTMQNKSDNINNMNAGVNSKNNSKNNSKKKLNNNIYRNNINNSTNKKINVMKNNKIVTLIKNKDNQSNIRRKLIKNKHRLNIRERTKSKITKSNKKPSKLVTYNNLKRPFTVQKKIEINKNLNNMKFNSKKLVNKRTNNSKIFQKKFSSKGNVNNRKKIVNPINVNNTIEDEEIPKKLKIHFNFQKINENLINSSKRTNSIVKHNIKLSSYETIKVKKDAKYMNNMYEINTTVKKKTKKNLSKLRQNNVNDIKFNLLHKKNIKKININLKNINNKYLENENKKNIIKTEISKEKEKPQLETKEIKKTKLPNINTEFINNANIKIIENNNTDTNGDFDINNEKNMKRNYNTKTNKKKIMNNKKYEKSIRVKNDYIMRTFDKQNFERFINNDYNKYSRISGNINMNILKNIQHRNTIDVEDNRNHRINIDISTNLGCRKNNNTSINNTTISDNNQNSKLIKEKTNKKKDISENDSNINIIDIDSNNNISKNNKLNKNITQREKINITNRNNTNINLKTIEKVLKTDPGKKTIIPSSKTLINIESYNTKDNNNQFLNMKIAPLKTNKINNYQKKEKKSKRQNLNIPKNLNKTSNSNFHSFIKNPFIPTETTNYINIKNTINQSNTTQSTNQLNKKINNTNNTNNTNNKNSQKLINNNKKKPCVTIRNTVINFNMIDSGLFLASLNRKKDSKKKSTIMNQNNSVNRLQNNHLYGVCNKFNNNLVPNINNNLHGDISIKTKTINVNSNNNLHYNGKKVENYMKNYKKIKSINNKKFINNYDKIHMKYNSMRLEDFYGLKGKRKTINEINTHKIGNTSNTKLINNEIKRYNTINNEDFVPTNDINKKNK